MKFFQISCFFCLLAFFTACIDDPKVSRGGVDEPPPESTTQPSNQSAGEGAKNLPSSDQQKAEEIYKQSETETTTPEAPVAEIDKKPQVETDKKPQSVTTEDAVLAPSSDKAAEKTFNVVGGEALLAQPEFASMRSSCGEGNVSACMQSSFLLVELDKKKEAAEGFLLACAPKGKTALNDQFCTKLPPSEKDKMPFLNSVNFRGCFEGAKLYLELGSDENLVQARRMARCACSAKYSGACDLLVKIK
jgi:hypothetical protein